MKKILIIILLALMLFSIISCESKKVVAEFKPPYKLGDEVCVLGVHGTVTNMRNCVYECIYEFTYLNKMGVIQTKKINEVSLIKKCK